jgi:hypothetical protein
MRKIIVGVFFFALALGLDAVALAKVRAAADLATPGVCMKDGRKLVVTMTINWS